MPIIHVLDERTANQIAAGEVVERPSSVVKELVENSLDAGANRIVVEVEGGGQSLLRITDDGCGMAPDDARLSLQRHATSKIQKAEDLLTVATMGFRGEAIPSIASVSRFELVTRQADQLAGYRLQVDGGHIADEGEFGCPPGTRITVRDLFFNTPARLKYLKTSATEMGQIGDTLSRLAMANPQVAMRFQSGPTQVFATPGTGSLLDTVTGLLGREVAKELLPVDYQDGAARVTGFIGRPSIARAGRSHQYFFVNNRSIRNFQGRFSLEEAYAHLLPGGRFPVCILFVTVDPRQVDVNVHPAKAEVRFEREREVKAALYKAARQTLGAHLLIPGTTVSAEGEVSVPDRAGEKAAAMGTGAPGAPAGAGPRFGAAGPSFQGGGASAYSDAPRQVSLWSRPGETTRQAQEEPGGYTLPPGGLQSILQQRASGGAMFGGEMAGGDAAGGRPEGWADPAGRLPDAVPVAPIGLTGGVAGLTGGPTGLTGRDLIRSLRPLGQVHQSYIACDGPEGLYLIDQHAAHERVFFEKFLAAAEASEARVQTLLFPITLDLTPAQAALWREVADIARESGIEAEPFGGNTLLVKSIPMGISEAHTARLIADFLDKLQEERVQATASLLDKRRRTLAALAACKAAIKAKDPLGPEMIAGLLKELAACESPHTCPHGRPTLICVTIGELEKRFIR